MQPPEKGRMPDSRKLFSHQCDIYKAEVTTTDNAKTKKYIGMTSNEFKVRYRNHTKSVSATRNTQMKQNYLNTFGI